MKTKKKKTNKSRETFGLIIEVITSNFDKVALNCKYKKYRV